MCGDDARGKALRQAATIEPPGLWRAVCNPTTSRVRDDTNNNSKAGVQPESVCKYLKTWWS